MTGNFFDVTCLEGGNSPSVEAGLRANSRFVGKATPEMERAAPVKSWVSTDNIRGSLSGHPD
jgi:hypothetical protein